MCAIRKLIFSHNFFLQNSGTYYSTHQRTGGVAREYSWRLENEGHDWIKSSQTAKLPKTGLITNRLISFQWKSNYKLRNPHYITWIILGMRLQVPLAPYLLGLFGLLILQTCNYHKNQCIRRTFLLKMFESNWRCSLSARTSERRAINLPKLTLSITNLYVSEADQ